MDDTKILSIAIMVLAVLAGSIFNNVCIGDLNNRIDDMRDLLRAEMAKNHSEMLHRFGDLDGWLTDVGNRLGRIEERFMR